MFFKLGFNPRKDEQHLQGIEFQEKEEEKDEKHVLKIIRIVQR